MLSSNRYNSYLTVMKTLIFLLLLCLSTAQTYLPKDGPLLLNDLFTINLARSGNDFWKTKDGWTTVISTYPVRPNTLTKVSIYLVSGDQVLFGCGKGEFGQLSSDFVGNIPNTVSYHLRYGSKFRQGSWWVPYASPAVAGDTIEMTIDLRPQTGGQVSFAKNGLGMGVAFSGLSYWGDIYIMFSILSVNHRVKVVSYTVQQ